VITEAQLFAAQAVFIQKSDTLIDLRQSPELLAASPKHKREVVRIYREAREAFSALLDEFKFQTGEGSALYKKVLKELRKRGLKALKATGERVRALRAERIAA